VEITYRINHAITAEGFVEVCRSSGLRRPIDDLARIQRMLDNANLTLSAWHAERLIGFARSLTDYGFCCYMSDLAVRAEYQKQGIGKELIRRTKAHIGSDCMLLLLSAPEAMDYYPHVGFAKVENGWIIPREQ
jgi:ribosomal protein S18 acetylase RimI-like enzyme